MRTLVVYGSKMGGVKGIAEAVGETLTAEGLDVDVHPATGHTDVAGYDAVIVGGAIYSRRWHRAARGFITRHAAALQALPVWLFSSGPLDDSAHGTDIPPIPQVAALMRRCRARAHATFGGRMPADAKGFPASAMAKEHAGDWRDFDQIRRWATGIAADLRAGTL